MSEIKIFENEKFGSIRTIEIDGMPWFVGKDVATALGYMKTENALARHVDEEDKTLTPFQGGCSTGLQKTIIINESGLYSLILSSKLPSAKAFKRWVTSEVLPTIRRHGFYATDETLDNNIWTMDGDGELRLKGSALPDVRILCKQEKSLLISTISCSTV